MKTTLRRYRKTHFFFNTSNKKNEAIDYLLALNVPFNCSSYGDIILLPKYVIKYDLDLMINSDFAASSIEYK